ncbi:MAG: hypothetical protein H7A21_09820 [Spirochaetales bacterium]|nr:hypothetical protein [Leptospiraceae bacterium]MCP5481720.1 hypothetical protein [Spirochaetales bacterium]
MQVPGPILNEERIQAAIEAGKSVEIRGYTLSGRYQEDLEFLIRRCLARLDREELYPVVYAVAQELTLWASLANMRHVYYEDRQLDLDDEAIVAAHEPDFLASVNRQNEVGYRRQVRDRGITLRTRVTSNESGMRIEVLSNAHHSAPLEARLRQSLDRAMGYTGIMEYFEDHPEDQLGRSMGLSFAILMLREEKLRPELMRLGRTGNLVTSRVEIPFDSSFASIRDRLERGEEIRPFAAHSLIPAGLEVQDLVMVRCPVCGRQIDERVFFPEVGPDMVDFNQIWQVVPNWRPDSGACASCLATFGPLS